EHDGEREPAVDQQPPELALRRIGGVAMHRMRVHGHQGELNIVGLGDGAARPMLVDVPDGKILQIAPVGRAVALGGDRLGLQGHVCAPPLCPYKVAYQYARAWRLSSEGL